MEEMYNVSSNPHVRDKMTTSRIMQLVVIALLPTTLFGIWNFGFRALLVVLVTVASSVFFEWLYNLSLIHISEPTRRSYISYAVFCLRSTCHRRFLCGCRYLAVPLQSS